MLIHVRYTDNGTKECGLDPVEEEERIKYVIIHRLIVTTYIITQIVFGSVSNVSKG